MGALLSKVAIAICSDSLKKPEARAVALRCSF